MGHDKLQRSSILLSGRNDIPGGLSGGPRHHVHTSLPGENCHPYKSLSLQKFNILFRMEIQSWQQLLMALRRSESFTRPSLTWSPYQVQRSSSSGYNQWTQFCFRPAHAGSQENPDQCSCSSITAF